MNQRLLRWLLYIGGIILIFFPAKWWGRYDLENWQWWVADVVMVIGAQLVLLAGKIDGEQNE